MKNGIDNLLQLGSIENCITNSFMAWLLDIVVF